MCQLNTNNLVHSAAEFGYLPLAAMSWCCACGDVTLACLLLGGN